MYHIDSPDYDLYAMNAEIEHFCEKHVLPRKMINDVLLVVEESLSIHNSVSAVFNIDLTISYSEKQDSLEIIYEYGGIEGNIFEREDLDELSLSIIKGLTSGIEFSPDKEKNKIIM